MGALALTLRDVADGVRGQRGRFALSFLAVRERFSGSRIDDFRVKEVFADVETVFRFAFRRDSGTDYFR